jgi:UDP-N-acetyl-D-mannosaminuronic acid dehydrogenase
VAVCDPHAATPTQPLSDAVRDADVVIVATNHSEFERPETVREILGLASEACLLVDPWNTLGTGQLYSYPMQTGAPLQPAAQVDGSPDTGH